MTRASTLPCLAIAMMATGCVQTSELPLSDNVVMIRATGISSGWISAAIVADQIPRQTLHKAAQVTLAHGYSYFRLAPARAATQQIGTTPISGQVIGNNVMLSGGNPVNRTTNDILVVMYHKSDLGAKGALNAKAILSTG